MGWVRLRHKACTAAPQAALWSWRVFKTQGTGAVQRNAWQWDVIVPLLNQKVAL